LAELPEPADLVILGVKNALLESQLELAGENGAQAAVIFASCVEEDSGEQPLAQRLATLAAAQSMTLCGGSCMGFLSFDGNLRALAFPERDDLQPGPITWLSHSGSVFTALLHNQRGLRFNLAVSAGMELTTTVADYLRYSLDLESTRLVAMFLETVRDPEGFREGLLLAKERDVPVVVLKIGREARARELVVAHSGALAGVDGAYEALFREYGVIRVGNLDEMADTLELLGAGRRASSGGRRATQGLSAIHDSGGERALLIDVAAEVGTPLAEISDATKKRMAAVLEPGLPAVNPLDAWGTGHDSDEIFLECMRALLDDEKTAALAFVVDLADELHDEDFGTGELAKQIFAETDKPFAVLSNLGCSIPEKSALALRNAGIPLLEGTATGLSAFGSLFSHAAFASLPEKEPAIEAVAPEVREHWRARLASDAAWTEHDALALLRDYGIPTAEGEIARSSSEAKEIAERLGWPVVVKTAAAISHKSDQGGVVVGVDDAAALETVYDDLSQRLGPRVLVQETAPKGVELALGTLLDAQFGPLVMVAAGGVWVELLDDRAFALPPLDKVRAERLLAELAINKLLAGARGSEPCDIGSIVDAMVRLSVLALDLGDRLAALDVNPLIAGPQGCMAVDALVVANRPPVRGESTGEENPR
jgi:acyl-CoA synthetase (NDP forming)